MIEADGKVWFTSYAATRLIEALVIIHDEWHRRVRHMSNEEKPAVGKNLQESMRSASTCGGGYHAMSPICRKCILCTAYFLSEISDCASILFSLHLPPFVSTR